MKKLLLASVLVGLVALLSYWVSAYSRIAFEPVTSGSGLTKDGFEVSFGVYRSNDGARVQKALEYRPTPELAEQELLRRIRLASRVIQRGPYMTSTGVQMGERAVLEFEDKHAAVVWTDGSRLHCIESDSLRHALAFEKSLAK